jgi:hypothetical protein
MKKFLLLGTVATIISVNPTNGFAAPTTPTVNPSQWTKILEEEAVTSFIDVANLQYTAPAAIFLVKQEFHEEQVTTIKGKSVRYKTSVALYAADCSKQKAFMPRILLGSDAAAMLVEVPAESATDDLEIDIPQNPVLKAGLSYYCKGS